MDLKIYRQNNSIRFESTDIKYNVAFDSLNVDIKDDGISFNNNSIKLYEGYKFYFSEIQDEFGTPFTSYNAVLTYLNGFLRASNIFCDCVAINSAISALEGDLSGFKTDIDLLNVRVGQNETDINSLDVRVSQNETDITNLITQSKAYFSVGGGVPQFVNIMRYYGTQATNTSEVTFYITDDGTAAGNLLFNNLADVNFQVTCSRNTTSNEQAPWGYVRALTVDGKGVIVRIKKSNTGRIRGVGTYRGNDDNVNSVLVSLQVTDIDN